MSQHHSPNTVSDPEALLRASHSHSVGELPILAAFCQECGIKEIVDRLCPSRSFVSHGTNVVAMILDTLSGRSPLYRVEDFWKGQDTELILGKEIDHKAFNDDALGRTLDAIHEAGTMKLFTEISLNACRKFGVQMDCMHFDTTSVNVWGDYDRCANSSDSDSDTAADSDDSSSKPLNICHGFSKDKRPDLKQFMFSLLCVEGNIPVIGSVGDGNTSDTKANNIELERVAALCKQTNIEQANVVYVADSKLVTEENLKLLNNNPFITRLPNTYKATGEAIQRAIDEDNWEDIGKLNKTLESKKRPAASYRASEQVVCLYGREYRAIVVHSSNLDKRKLKGIDRKCSKAEKAALKAAKKASRQTVACRADAETALKELEEKHEAELWKIRGEIEEVPHYARGRVAKGKKRKVTRIEYKVHACAEKNIEAIEQLKVKAGHFVLLTNVPKETEEMAGTEALADSANAMDAKLCLTYYKEQQGVEQGFSFLKEPLIANDTFLKKPSRIKALGVILLLALLIWSLMQRACREAVKKDEVELTDLDNKPTQRPTAFIVIHKFRGTQILRFKDTRVLSKNFNRDQLQYLKALGLDPGIFTTPPGFQT